MDWIIANPLFTWLLPAASLPVLFHLFFKLKKRPRVFPTLMFFDQIDPKLSARRQIRQWLVLLLRTLFLLFLLLALARPMWLIGGGTGSVAVVCVVDNSGSMSGAPLKAAVEAARTLASNLSAKDAVGITTLVEDPTVALPPGLESDKTQIKTALDRIVATEATGDPAGALQRAFALLESSSATRFEVHVFTDLQENEWNRPTADLKPPRAGTTIIVHRLASLALKQPNVSIAGTKLPAKRLLTGRSIPIQVTLVNPSDADAAIRLNWVDDADNKGTLEVAVPRQAEKNVPVIIKPAAAGFHWAQVWLEGDGFDADNRAGIGFVTAEKSAVLFLGKPDEFGLLPLAISPASEGALSGLVPAFGTAEDIARLKPVMVVAPWSAAGALRPFVEQGGNLLVVPPVASPGPDWLGATPGALESQPKGAPVMLFRMNATIFADLRDDNGQVPLRSKAFKFHPLQPADDQEVVLGLDDGRALFLEHRLGKGMVFVSGLAFDSSWTTLPLKGAFLAVAQSMALAHEAEADNTLAIIAGERVTEAREIKSLAGSPLDWKGDAKSPPVFPRAGVYQVKSDKETRYIAVRSSDKEGVFKFVTGGKVAALAGLKYAVRNFEDLESFLRQAIRVHRGLDLFLPLLLLAILTLVLEAWLANPLPRKTSPKSEIRNPKQSGNAAIQQTAAAMFAIGFRVFPLATIQWRPQLNPLLCGVLVLFLGAWLYWTYRRLTQRFSPGKSLALLTPKVLVMAFVVFALFEPVADSERREALKGKLIVVTDVSSSMDVVDDGVASRRQRAGKILAQIKDALPADVTVEALEFDTRLRPAGLATNAVRGTDLGGCLVALADRPALGIVLLTDGGDEPVRPATLPSVPVTVVGIGTNPTNWHDIAIAGLEAPATVEKDTQFEVAADLVARGPAGQVTVKLDRAGKTIAEQTADLSHKRVRVKFPVTCPDPGLQRFRLAVEQMPGELSYLNNERTFSVDVQRKTVHVLFFTRELGQDFKMIRGEIGRDPGIAFTALYRTLSERFTVQGDRLTGDEPLEAGFPTDLKTLQLFDCVVIGSFSASDWTKEQFAVLTNYVAEGGALVFLGGEKSFGLGGYAGSPVAGLLPWQVESSEPELARGTFAVSIPATGQGHPIVAGLDVPLTLSSANNVGPLKPGATALLSANVNGRNIPVVAVQPFGKGRVLGLASNTQWEWARKSEPLRNAYGLFWRQAVRNLTGKAEGGRYLAVRWDKDHYLPGEQATAEIRVTGLTNARLSATLQAQMLPVDPRQGRANEFVAQCRFKERGEYVFRLVAYQGEAVMDSYEKVLPVAPPLAEGSRLELDEEALKKIAEKTGGLYVPEHDADQINKSLAARFWQRTITTETPLVTAGPQFAILIMALCVVEWWLRRKSNLI